MENEVAEDEEHPLRILSEENLTVVSSFRGSAEDLANLTNHDQVDPSKLSDIERKLLEDSFLEAYNALSFAGACSVVLSE